MVERGRRCKVFSGGERESLVMERGRKVNVFCGGERKKGESSSWWREGEV